MATSGHPSTALSVSVDIGGTFTDVTLLDRHAGHLWTVKVPTTSHDPSLGFMNGIDRALQIAQRAATDLAQVVHGTTVATNLILEGKGTRAGLLTNRGFRHVLEIGRHDIPRGANLYSWRKPQRPVPPERVYEIAGSLDYQGRELESLDEQAVRAVTRRLRDQGVGAVAICFLHSYTNPVHERRAREVLLEEWPEVPVTISSEVLPTFREFERSMVTILNAYVMPAVSSYIERLEQRLRERSVGAHLMLMKSNGGVASARTIRREPVQTALSGPAAGVVGMQLCARLAGFDDVIGIDIGGTSADISLIKSGAPGMTAHGKIGAWPLTLPMIDINTIGAGGGSIARVSDTGALTVGPESAGAQPGPVCYGRGGTEPTVTDAHAVLGHLPPFLLQGEMKLDVDSAREAIHSRIAKPLRLSVTEAARGILELADNVMVGAIRVVSVERGNDPRDFALVPFGGAGPLHGGSLARLLGIHTQLIPPSPGVLSAIGLLVSNLRSDFQRTCLHRGGDPDLSAITEGFRALDRDAAAWFEEEKVPEVGRSVRQLVSMRYEGQGFEIQVPWESHSIDPAAFALVVESFHRQHETLYTFCQRDVAVEIVTLHVEAIGALPPPTFAELANTGSAASARTGEQEVHFATGTVRTPIYDRTKLGKGSVVAGPAIFTQLDTTILVLPGQSVSIDRYGNMLIREAEISV